MDAQTRTTHKQLARSVQTPSLTHTHRRSVLAMSDPARMRNSEPLPGVLDPFAPCGDAVAFEALIQAQLASQEARSRNRLRDAERAQQPQTLDPAVASRALHAAGALKTYKPDAVVANGKLDTLSASQLQLQLKQQRSMLANTALLKSLPDGGARIHTQVAAIEAQLKRHQAREEAQLRDVQKMLEGVSIASGTTDEAAAPTDSAGAHHDDAAADSASVSHAATAASSASVSTAASSMAFTGAFPRHGQGGGGANGSSQFGRGSAATAASCAADVVNARIARETKANIESKFRRPPPTVLSAEEATSDHTQGRGRAGAWGSGDGSEGRWRLTECLSLCVCFVCVLSRLMRVKDEDWNASAMLFERAAAAGSAAAAAAAAAGGSYRDPSAAGFEEEADDTEDDEPIDDEAPEEDEEGQLSDA